MEAATVFVTGWPSDIQVHTRFEMQALPQGAACIGFITGEGETLNLPGTRDPQVQADIERELDYARSVVRNVPLYAAIAYFDTSGFGPASVEKATFEVDGTRRWDITAGFSRWARNERINAAGFAYGPTFGLSKEAALDKLAAVTDLSEVA